MKKLMITLAAVAVAAASQAASISWTSNSKSFCDADKNPTTTPTGGEIVLVLMDTATDWANATVIPTAAEDTLGKTTLTIATSSSKLGRVSGKVMFTYYGVGDERNFIENGDYLALMWKDSDGNLNQLKYTADDAVVNAVWEVTGLSSDSSNPNGKAIAMSGNFYAGAVPEPTSAMLLLLGVAGLALRRRRA